MTEELDIDWSDYSPMVKRAYEFADKAHKKQTRWGGDPYITHPIRVCMSLKDKGPYHMIVALLHDVIEDTTYTEYDLRKEFDNAIVCAVVVLSKFKNENYFHFITRIVNASEMAIEVKIADISDNLRDLKDGTMKDKYLLARYILQKELIERKNNAWQRNSLPHR